jgi:hypothetical protein
LNSYGFYVEWILEAFVGDASGAVMEFMKFKDINAEAVNQALKMEVGGLLRMGPG